MRFLREGWDTYEIEIPEGENIVTLFKRIEEDPTILENDLGAEIIATTDGCTHEFEISDIEEMYYESNG
jgi:hypothetical protein